MDEPEHLAKLREGIEAWNRWRKEHADVVPKLNWAEFPRQNLSGVDLSGANLSGAKLYRAELRGANLGGAKLYQADLSGAKLYRANLIGADLSGANFDGAEFDGADLRGAKLYRANLIDANLHKVNLSRADLSEAELTRAYLVGSDLSGAQLGGTVFVDTNLSDVKGLDTCDHRGPSTLDHRTLARSGSLPLAFLRGCGLPDRLIEYLPSLLNQAIQFYSCFITYSTKDQEFADRLHADLQNKGVRCWFAPHEIQGGKKIYEQIDEAIRLYDRLLLILSEHSMESEWVKTEIAKARKREIRECRRMLFPVRLVEFQALRDWECFDSDTGKDSAREIREF